MCARLQSKRCSRAEAHLEGHAVSQQHCVTHIDGHAVGRHGLLYLCHDDGARRLNPQELPSLNDVIGVSLDALHPAGPHDLLQVCPLHQQLIPTPPPTCKVRRTRHQALLLVFASLLTPGPQLFCKSATP